MFTGTEYLEEGSQIDFSMDKQPRLLLLWRAQSRQGAGADFGVVGQRVIRSLNSSATLPT